MGKKKEMHSNSAKDEDSVSDADEPRTPDKNGDARPSRQTGGGAARRENGADELGTGEIEYIEYLGDAGEGGDDDFDPPVRPMAVPEPAPQATADASIELSEAQSQIETLTREKSMIYDQLLRRQAEFENFRKRFDRERAEIYQRTRAEVLLELLPVLDNFERALVSLETSGDDPEALHQGVALIHKQLKDAVTKMGLQPVESIGKSFDPNVHEAITVEPTDEHEENTIIEEFQRGYKLGDRLLRPARVKVAGTPER
jgi:molecular chaperone GrpE